MLTGLRNYFNAHVVELVDTPGLEPGGLNTRIGSSPMVGTGSKALPSRDNIPSRDGPSSPRSNPSTDGDEQSRDVERNIITQNETYLEDARRAIQNLFGDTSVSIEVAIQNMEELRDEIEMTINVLKADL